ncbi:hypothetical protein [Gemmatimonas sp.]
MSSTPYLLSDVTLVLGPPTSAREPFADFQLLAARGDAVAGHTWETHEYAALDALTARDGAVDSHTLLETMVGGVLQVGVIVADVERQWVRHADGQLYAALTFSAEDVRPRAAAVALRQSEAIAALNAVSGTIAELDGRAWLAWSSVSRHDVASHEQTARTVALVSRIADTVLAERNAAAAGTDESPLDLREDLLAAIRLGVHHADRPQLSLASELRALRHHDPLRYEWLQVSMDAFFLAAQSPARVRAHAPDDEATGLAYLYVGRERTERLKADPFISPRFRGELAARAFMTAYALHRVAPAVSRAMLERMGDMP